MRERVCWKFWTGSYLAKQLNDAFYYAECLSVMDCLYRNMYRVEYLVFTDLDEIIVPQQHRNWREMMRALHQENIATYQFLHSAILPEVDHSTSTC